MTDNQRTLSFWDDIWTSGKHGWHLKCPNSSLVANVKLLFPHPDKKRIFVPLCGKSLDLLWLYKEGYTVVGVEGLDNVVQEFFQEHDLAHTVSQLPWGKLYQSSDNRIQIYVCDLFDLPVQQLGKFEAVWDRGSLVAIDDCDRPRYAVLMKQLLQPHFRYLLDTVVYTQNANFSGPPSSVPTEEVKQLFDDVAEVQLLTYIDRTGDPVYKDRIKGNFVENITLLSPKLS